MTNNIILQHYEGNIPEHLRIAMDSVKSYAKRLGVEYRHISGKPFDERTGLTSQKFAFFNEEYDDYDVVVMIDADIVVPENAVNIFDIKGLCRPNDGSLVRGQLYKADRKLRQQLRETLTYDFMKKHLKMNDHKLDERAMRRALNVIYGDSTEWALECMWQEDVTQDLLYDDFITFHFGSVEKHITTFVENVHDNRTFLEWQQTIVPDIGNHFRKNRAEKQRNLRKRRNDWLDSLPKELTEGLKRVH